MRLICISRYRNGEVEYNAGQEVDVRDDEGEFLLRDSPGSFTKDGPKPEGKKPAKTKATATGIQAIDRGNPGGEIRSGDGATVDATDDAIDGGEEGESQEPEGDAIDGGEEGESQEPEGDAP